MRKLDEDTQVTKALQATSILLNSLIDDVRDNTKETSSLRAELKALGEIVRILSRMVRDGNGGHSIITRLAVAEDTIDKIQKAKEREDKSEEANARVNSSRRWDVISAILVALISLGISLFAAIE